MAGGAGRDLLGLAEGAGSFLQAIACVTPHLGRRDGGVHSGRGAAQQPGDRTSRSTPGTSDRPVQARRTDRRRRHGRGLPGRADRAGQAAGRPQGHQGGDGHEAGARPLRGRAAGAGADGPSRTSPRCSMPAATRPTGRPYFVMELVKGVPITKFCDERKLSLARAAGTVRARLPCDPARAPEGDHPPRHQAVQRAGRARTTASRCRR